MSSGTPLADTRAAVAVIVTLVVVLYARFQS
jgi:hypothetical protein